MGVVRVICRSRPSYSGAFIARARECLFAGILRVPVAPWPDLDGKSLAEILRSRFCRVEKREATRNPEPE